MRRQAVDKSAKVVRLQAALDALRQVRLIMEASDCPEFERASIAFARRQAPDQKSRGRGRNEVHDMMAFWSPEVIARAARLDPDPHGFIRAAAEFIADRLQRAGMSSADARSWGDTLAAEAAAHLEDAGRRGAAA